MAAAEAAQKAASPAYQQEKPGTPGPGTGTAEAIDLANVEDTEMSALLAQKPHEFGFTRRAMTTIDRELAPYGLSSTMTSMMAAAAAKSPEKDNAKEPTFRGIKAVDGAPKYTDTFLPEGGWSKHLTDTTSICLNDLMMQLYPTLVGHETKFPRAKPNSRGALGIGCWFNGSTEDHEVENEPGAQICGCSRGRHALIYSSSGAPWAQDIELPAAAAGRIHEILKNFMTWALESAAAPLAALPSSGLPKPNAAIGLSGAKKAQPPYA